MALYKNGAALKQSAHAEFDKDYPPGTETVNPGIYQCTGCGDEIGIAKAHKLPPQNLHQHPARCGGIRWRLLVSAVQATN